MNKYETILIIKPTLAEEETKGTIEKIVDLINANGKATKVEELGKRKLAYPIQKFNEGYYVLINFKSELGFTEELNRVYNITDEIIKSIIVKAE